MTINGRKVKEKPHRRTTRKASRVRRHRIQVGRRGQKEQVKMERPMTAAFTRVIGLTTATPAVGKGHHGYHSKYRSAYTTQV